MRISDWSSDVCSSDLLNVDLLSGVALNNSVGGINRYAVDHSIKLGGRIVWMPTFSAANHIEQHRRDAHFDEKFPTPKEKLLRSEEHTSELQSLMRISYAVFCLKKKKTIITKQ